MEPGPSRRFEAPRAVERVTDPSALGSLDLGGLSEFFDPFLSAFALDTLRVGGEVWLSARPGSVHGLFLYLESERSGSVFTRLRDVAESFAGLHAGSPVFSDFRLGAKSEAFQVFEGAPTGTAPAHQFRHPVRAAGDEDRDELLGLMRGVHGVVDDGWFRTVVREHEVGFVVDGDREIAGAGWVSVSNGVGRLHSLSVRPRYRRTRVGTDLWHARMRWAAGNGARRVVTEISEHNVGSRAIAEAGGMRRVGEIYRSVPR
jgi:GNAT superfamily N-acetyltransferase